MANKIALDPYALLGVRKDATERDVRLAFLRLVRKFHPDKNVSEIREEESQERQHGLEGKEKYNNLIVKYHALYEAYCILKDPSRRRAYDEASFCDSLRSYRIQNWHKSVKLEELDYFEEDQVFSYICRCGGMLVIRKSDIEEGFNLFPCSDCSSRIIITF